jgi:hypothetical protein
MMEDHMKKIMMIVGVAGLLAFSACASAPKDTSPLDRGAYPAGLSAARAVTLYIHENVGVLAVDDQAVEWENKDQRQQFVSIGSGMHVFQVKYHDGKLQSSGVPLAAQLASGNSYLIKPTITDEDNVEFRIVTYINGQEGEEVSVHLPR